MTVEIKIEHDGGPYIVSVMPTDKTGQPLQSHPAAVLKNKGDSTIQSIWDTKSLLISEIGASEKKQEA